MLELGLHLGYRPRGNPRPVERRDHTRLLNARQGGFRDLVHAALLTDCRYDELWGNYDAEVIDVAMDAAAKAAQTTRRSSEVKVDSRTALKGLGAKRARSSARPRRAA
jgi:hypothetical protein